MTNVAEKDPRRVAMVSLHTSPLDQPGTGDAGGMNVYVLELSRKLAERGIEVDVFTRATSSESASVVPAADGVHVHHVPAGPFEGLGKADLPGQLCAFAREVLRAEAQQPPGHYDVVHSHYWLSGQVGALARDRWRVPLVHSMHTMAKVKNQGLALGDTPEPPARVIGEDQVVAASDLLLANTRDEARQLVELYGADPRRVEIVHPGVDLDCFRPVADARSRLGLAPDALVVLFAGRIQPLKAPDVLLKAVAVLLARNPHLRNRLVVPVIGGPSGSGLAQPDVLVRLAADLGIADVVRFVPPVTQRDLAVWFSAATVVAVPSYNESFGLVAIEAQAAGAPVVAAAVGGLPTVVADGTSGLLVAGHDPVDWAATLERVLCEQGLVEKLSAGALTQAASFSWDVTAEATLAAYAKAHDLMRLEAAR